MHIVKDIATTEPFPWGTILDYLGARLIPQAERIANGVYERREHNATVNVAYDARNHHLRVRATGRIHEQDILPRITRLFQPEHTSHSIDAHLRGSPMLAQRIAQAPGLRPLGCWSPFELCVRTVVGQQVSVAAANTLMGRLVARCGDLSPQALHTADLTAIGMPGRRVGTLQRLAHATLSGELELDSNGWQHTERGLARLSGIGAWTLAYLAIRLGRQPNILPETDIGLLRAANATSPAELRKIAEPWQPYRAYAATYLWSLA